MDGKALQVAERGIPGTEIVHGDTKTQSLQFGQYSSRGRQIVHDRRFGDLQFQVARRQPGVAQGSADLLCQILLAKLASRQVDRHGAGQQARVLPGAHLTTGLAHHPVADRQDEAGVLGHRNEFIGADHAQFRRLPAQQCLPPHQAACPDFQFGLVVQGQFLMLQRLLEARLKQHTALDFFGQIVAEHSEAIAAGRFGAMQGQIGIAHQDAGRLAVGRITDDTDADADPQAIIADIEFPPHGVQQGLPHLLGLFGGGVFQQDHEFVAAETGQESGSRQARPDAPGDRHQQQVAVFVAQRVIHVLEMIEIQQHHSTRCRLIASEEGLVEPFAECGPVRQSGQVIMREHMAHLAERAAHRFGIDRTIEKIIGKHLVGMSQQVGRAAHLHIHDEEQFGRRHQQQGQHQALEIAMGDARTTQVQQDGNRQVKAEHPPFERHFERGQSLAHDIHRRNGLGRCQQPV